MTIREQLEILIRFGVEHVVVGGQAGVLRQAIEFSQDLDIVIRPTEENAVRVQQAVVAITGAGPDTETILSRDFQQYFRAEDGTEIDVHLKLMALPDFEAAVRNSSVVDFLGLPALCLELPALYASKRTDRPRDAQHRQAIEDRLRHLLVRGLVAPDEILLACCLDTDVAKLPLIASGLVDLERTTRQPLLQARLLACLPATSSGLAANPALHPRVRTLLQMAPELRGKILDHPVRRAALFATLALELPAEGYHPVAG